MLIAGGLSDTSGSVRNSSRDFAAALGFAAGVFDKNVVFLVGALAVLGAGVVAAIPTFRTLPPKILTGAGAASSIALIKTIGQLVGIVSPVMVGSVKDLTGSTTRALYVIGCLYLFCASLLLAALPRELRSSDVARK